MFPIRTLETAPKGSQEALSALQATFGFVPNLIGAMANSPELLRSLAALFQIVHSGNFSEPQVQILLLTNAVTNQSEWPIAFHSHLALQQGIAASEVEAIRAGRLPEDKIYAALSRFARALIESRGRINDRDVQAFLSAGFDEGRLLEVIAVVAASTITNYTASVTRPPIEPQFQQA